MEPESDYDDADEEAGAGSLGLAVKLLIVAGSLGAASVVGMYVHPHLLPLATEHAPQLWSGLRGWLTAPVLFLLLNMVVGTLYVSSSLMSKAQTVDEGAQPVSTTPDVTTSPAVNGAAGERAPPAAPSKATGLRARLGQSRGLSRLVRSKSEQIPAVSAKAGSGVAGRLKKAGTVETSSPRQKLRPVVVVADPPDDAPAGHEEVDKKADAFISKFYHRMKLQRLESLKRQERQE